MRHWRKERPGLDEVRGFVDEMRKSNSVPVPFIDALNLIARANDSALPSERKILLYAEIMEKALNELKLKLAA